MGADDLIFVLFAAEIVNQPPSSADTSLLVALISLAGTLLLVVGGIVQVYLSRQRMESEKKVQGEKETNVEKKFEQVDSKGDYLLTRLAELDQDNKQLRERLANLEGRYAQQSEEVRLRNEKIDQLTGEIAVWQYRVDQLTGSGQGGSSGS